VLCHHAGSREFLPELRGARMTTLHTIAEIMAAWTAISCLCGLFMGRFIAFGMGERHDR
tara:strand:+ start:295 stop:471 length:177 start_codon:yes stop_codon:yes gene_type:complete